EREPLAANADAGHRQYMVRLVVETDTTKINRQIVLQAADDHLEDALKVLALTDGARSPAEQFEPAQLRVQFLLRLDTFGNFRLERDCPLFDLGFQVLV